MGAQIIAWVRWPVRWSPTWLKRSSVVISLTKAGVFCCNTQPDTPWAAGILMPIISLLPTPSATVKTISWLFLSNNAIETASARKNSFILASRERIISFRSSEALMTLLASLRRRVMRSWRWVSA